MDVLKDASVIAVLLFSCLTSLSQSPSSIDSLETLYTEGTYAPQQKLLLLKELAINHPDADRALFYSEQLIEAARAVDSIEYLFQGYLEQGNAYRLKSDLSQAMESYYEGARIVDNEKYRHRLGAVYVAIADVYAIMGNYPNAMSYHQKAIQILREAKDSVNIASALLNAGDAFITLNQLDTALLYTREAELIFQKINSQLGQAYSLGNLGMIYAKLGDNLQASENMNEAILLLEELQEYYPIAVYLNYIADIYFAQGDEGTALKYANRSLELAVRHGLKEQISDAYLKLAEIYEQAGKLKESYAYYKNHIAYKDSVKDITAIQQMADLRTDFEVSKKQIEVDLANQQKRNQQIIAIGTGIALILIGLLAIGLFRRYRYIKSTNRIIEQERNRSEALLLNILPKETAQELKQHGKVQAKKFASVTVLFADFKGFTQYAENLTPEQLVETVDYYFSKFDTIIQQHSLEKIKTIGDAYMCAGGLPFPSADHALKVVQAAIAMAEFVAATRKSAEVAHTFEVRIGIHSGPVVAGVVGTQKFAYDIWGDTVNIAARMESASEPGKINISESTYLLVKEIIPCKYRGEIDVKNKGTLKMYFVETT
jgi:adenylate cyclase